MAITGSFLYGLSVSKMLQATLPDMNAEDLKGLLVDDTYAATAANADAHDFYPDITNQSSGAGYSSGGNVLTGTVLTVGSPLIGQLKYDITTDPTWPTSTITAAMAHIGYDPTVGTAAVNPLMFLQDFVTAVTSSAGTLTVQLSTGGAFYIDYSAIP